MKPVDVRFIVDAFGWKEVRVTNPVLLSFIRDKTRIDIYFTRMTVVTAMHHPKKGKTQLTRRNVSYDEFVKIVDDVRTHTGRGYYRKPSDFKRIK